MKTELTQIEDLASFEETQQLLKQVSNAIGEMDNNIIKNKTLWLLALDLRIASLESLTEGLIKYRDQIESKKNDSIIEMLDYNYDNDYSREDAEEGRRLV